MSNLITSLWRAQTFAYLAYHLSWFLFGFYPCENLELGSSPYQALVHQKRISYEYLVAFFDVGRFTGLSSIERSYLSSFGVILT